MPTQTKKKYVRTTYTGCEYITPNKLYEVFDENHIGGSIIDDDEEVLPNGRIDYRFICYEQCPHLNGNDWEIVYED